MNIGGGCLETQKEGSLVLPLELDKDTRALEVADRQLEADLRIEIAGIKHGIKLCSETGATNSCGEEIQDHIYVSYLYT